MDLGGETKKLFCCTQISNLGFRLLWLMVHFIISIWYFALGIARTLESCVISSGLLKKYKALSIAKVKYLAIVVDSEEAIQTLKVIQLLQWLETIGVKHVCLYDSEGVLKKSRESILERLSNSKLSKESTQNNLLLDKKLLTTEFASNCDGKEAMTKAANLLFVKYYLGGDQEHPVFTESDVAEALIAAGSGGLQPDLLLVYGPARCHLGFPAWRIRYTEIVHMGPLKSMKYGSLLKAVHKFTMVRQNYGT